MYGYIYKTTNLINGKIYVGQHTKDHFDTSYFGSGKLLKQAIKKYGIENFRCDLLECCEDKKELEQKEIYWIDKLNCCKSNIGYNMSAGGFTPRFIGERHPMYGKHQSESAKEKNRKAHLGKVQSKDTIQKRVKSRSIYNAKKHQENLQKWIDEKHICECCGNVMQIKYGSGRFCNKECVFKHISERQLGKKASKETIEKLRQSHKGQKSVWTGKSRDEETRKKISKTLSAPRPNRLIIYKIDDMIFNGLVEGGKYFGVTKSCMSLWIKQGHTVDGREITLLVDNQLHRKK